MTAKEGPVSHPRVQNNNEGGLPMRHGPVTAILFALCLLLLPALPGLAQEPSSQAPDSTRTPGLCDTRHRRGQLRTWRSDTHGARWYSVVGDRASHA